MMTVNEIENMLQNDCFISYAHEFRKNGTVVLKSPEETRAFFINFLLLETTAGVNYLDAELLDTYTTISKLVESKTVISSNELPYHQKKKRPVQERKFNLDTANCCCTMQ